MSTEAPVRNQLRAKEQRTRPSQTPGPATAKRSSWALPLRILSGAVFLPVLVLFANTGGLAVVVFVALEVVLAMLEFDRMMRGKGLQPLRAIGLLAGLGVVWMAYRPETVPAGALATGGILLALALALRRPERPRHVESLAVTLFGVVYIAWLSSHLVLLRELPWRAGTGYADGASFVLLAFLVTWGCDTGAYAFGRIFGRTRPWARISPRKSVEGAFGGFVTAIGAAFLARAWFAPYLAFHDAAIIGILVGVFAQVGDFVESLLKRDAQHDDSSDLIPGHGGVLDRFDSLYFAAPVLFYYLLLVVYRVP